MIIVKQLININYTWKMIMLVAIGYANKNTNISIIK